MNVEMVTKDGFEYFLREMEVYSKIYYQGLTRLHEVLINDHSDKIYLVMELASKGQLIDWDDDTEKWKFLDVKRKRLLKEPELRRIMRDIVKSVYVRNKSSTQCTPTISYTEISSPRISSSTRTMTSNSPTSGSP